MPQGIILVTGIIIELRKPQKEGKDSKDMVEILSRLPQALRQRVCLDYGGSYPGLPHSGLPTAVSQLLPQGLNCCNGHVLL